MISVYHDGVAIGRRRYNSRPAKRVLSFQGLPINIEIEAGDVKSGIDESGVPWQHVYEFPYGEVKGTRALSDGDPVDVYIGPSLLTNIVYCIHQGKKNQDFDEDKIMLGFASEGDAILAYKTHGPPWGFLSCDVMTFDNFVHGYLASNRKHK